MPSFAGLQGLRRVRRCERMDTEIGKIGRPKRGRLQDPVAEYVDFVGLEQRFNIRRTLAYDLIHAGKIKSVVIKKPGRTRGRRLISLASLRSYLTSLEG